MEQWTGKQLQEMTNEELLDSYSSNLCIGSDSCSYFSTDEQDDYLDKAEEERVEIMRRLAVYDEVMKKKRKIALMMDAYVTYMQRSSSDVYSAEKQDNYRDCAVEIRDQILAMIN